MFNENKKETDSKSKTSHKCTPENQSSQNVYGRYLETLVLLSVVPASLCVVRYAIDALTSTGQAKITGAENSVLVVANERPDKSFGEMVSAHKASGAFDGIRVVGECFHHALVGPPVDDVLMCGHCFDWLERKSLTSRMLKRASPFLPR